MPSKLHPEDEKQIQPASTPSLAAAIEMWAQASTDPASARRHDLLRDKRAALLSDGADGRAAGFFVCVPKPPQAVTPLDVRTWQAYLEDMGLAPASVYARISRLSSFYEWLMREPAFKDHIRANPVRLARPKAPKAYQSEKTRSLTDAEATALLRFVQSLAAGGDLSARRDYALLRFFFATGKRRSEIIGLRWGDLRFTADTLIIHTREKGGLYRATEIRDPGVAAALFAYLQATDRWDATADQPLMEADDPLWLRHDRAATGRQPLSSHGFVKLLKQYARIIGVDDIHLHQTRHTVARIVGEESGDLSAVQTVLGHQNINTTRIYLERVSVKHDKHSRDIARRLRLDDDPA
jgi:integrase